MSKANLIKPEKKYFMMKMGNTLVRLLKTTDKEVKDVEYSGNL